MMKLSGLYFGGVVRRSYLGVYYNLLGNCWPRLSPGLARRGRLCAFVLLCKYAECGKADESARILSRTDVLLPRLLPFRVPYEQCYGTMLSFGRTSSI